MRCSMCGHESPPGSSFCLNCGTSLQAPPAYAQTPQPQAGLPVICQMCRSENPPGMKFCRGCGSALMAPPPMQPQMPMMTPPPMPVAPPPLMTPPPMQAQPMAYPGVGPNTLQTGPTLQPANAAPPSLGAVPTNQGVGAPAPRNSNATIPCPRCGTPTPVGFAFCQGCGLHMQGVQPTDPGAGVPPRQPAVDPMLQTMAAPEPRPAPMPAYEPPPPPMPAYDPGPVQWGSAVLVNRDGSDGQRFSLVGEAAVIGRAGADVAFDEDRFLARQHARLERTPDGSVRIVAIDVLNGIFRKTDAPVELVDGSVVLVGREVLRFEKVDADERAVAPLIRHGVALFGSPPREPWGRLIQIIPSGGYRDVRHLANDEIVLGREEGEIVFRDDAFMSRRHAAINWDGKRAMLTDLGSSNGTFVRIHGTTNLKHGDHVRMGDQLLRIELR